MKLAHSTLVLVVLALVLATAADAQQQGACPNGIRNRRSFRSLSDAERKAYGEAIKAMKASGAMDKMTRKHREGMEYHGTVWFLPMHRALLWEFENELIKASKGALTALPYWDELADSRNPTASSVFSSAGLGQLVAGPLRAPFVGLTDDSNQQVTREPRRNANAGFTWIPQSQVLARGLSQFTSFGDMSRTIEASPHNQYHMLIGGHMGDPNISPADPIFWLHHNFVDLLWAAWQAVRPQNAEDLSTRTSQGQAKLASTDRVVLYTDKFTNLDMLRYRTRLCYTYDQVSTSTGGSASRLRARQAVGANDTTAVTDPINAPVPDVRDITSLLKLANFTDAEWGKIMPKVPIADIRQVEAGINAVIDALNQAIASKSVDPKTLPIVDDLVANINVAAKSQTDDFKDSAIPEVQAAASGKKSAASTSVAGGSAAVVVGAVAMLAAIAQWV
ncbi:hypothetical protein H9P43_007675 [Blastocladiella emersonii ATCC 22665]|nr:hypothetical protein H9P43_007675 [Blastocladiella emersonii ATCC 22665]